MRLGCRSEKKRCPIKYDYKLKRKCYRMKPSYKLERGTT